MFLGIFLIFGERRSGNQCLQVSFGAMLLKGAGGVPDLGMVKIEFYVVSNRGEPQLPDAFYRFKKYCS